MVIHGKWVTPGGGIHHSILMYNIGRYVDLVFFSKYKMSC
jgi:hypothetical protein